MKNQGSGSKRKACMGGGAGQQVRWAFRMY